MTYTARDLARNNGHGKARSLKPDTKGRYGINCPIHGGDGQNLLVWDKADTGHIMFKCETGDCPSRAIHEYFRHNDPDYARSCRQGTDMPISSPAAPPPKRNAPAGTEADAVANFTASDYLKTTPAADGLCKGKDDPPYKETARWIYKHADGTPDIRVIRKDKPGCKKIFGQHHFVGGKEIYKKKPGIQPLYRWNLIHNSTRELIITEGEKCCDAAAERFPDYDITTWPGGSGTVLEADWQRIAERSVILWPDPDGPGKEAMRKLAGRLLELGCRVKVVDVSCLDGTHDLADPEPDGVSYADMLAAAAVVDVADALPAEKPALQIISSTDLMQIQFPPTRFVVQDFIPEGVTMLAAPPKIGKSFFSEELACCVSTGRDFLTLKTGRMKTLYVDAEQAPRLIQNRLKALSWDGGADGLDFCSMPGVMLDEAFIRDHLTPIVKANGYDLIILDTMARLLPRPKGGGDGYQNATEMLKPFHEWCHSLGKSALLVHHTRRQGAIFEGGESHDSITGGYGYASVVDTIVTFKRSEKDLFKVSTTGRVAQAQTYALESEGPHWIMKGDFEEAAGTEERRKILEAIRALGGDVTATDIAEELGKERSNVSHTLRKMCAKDLVKQSGTKQRYKYSLPD